MKLSNVRVSLCLALLVAVVFPVWAQLGAPVVAGGQVADIQGESGGEVLIDFSILAESPDSATEIDFSDMAPYYGFSQAEEPFMRIDLSIQNWEIFIPPASRYLAFQYPSYLAPAAVKSNSIIFAGEKVLGVRLFFPVGRQESFSVVPPFPIPFYSGENGNQFLNKGVIKNVGAIKEIQLETYGQYYKVDISIILEDMRGRTTEIPLGDLNFFGWRRMVWQNPDYNRLSSANIYDPKKENPIFPPAYRLKAIVFRHGMYDRVTDVLAYIKSIKVIYDEAWDEEAIQVDNEAFWRGYYNALDRSGFPAYKKYILERFLVKHRANILKSKESFIKADPIIPRE
jgi:hypothetical protein